MQTITVLGSGNAYFEDGRGHAAFLATSGPGRTVLVDAGATALLRMREAGIDRDVLDAVLITHFHGDHVLGLPPILLDLRTFARRVRPLTVAGPEGTASTVERLLATAFPGFDPGFPLDFVTLGPGRAATVAGIEVEARAQTHRPESLGYRLTGAHGRIAAFSGDCRFDDRLVDLVDGADVAFVEVGLPGNVDPDIAHVALHEMLTRHGELGARRLVFTHVNDGIASALEDAGIGTVARDGLVVDLAAR
jgi:ribonuclease BN (tRNA processing enzyme)